MAFIKFEPRFTGNTDRVALSHKMLNIGKAAYLRMGKPERIDVLYDVENKAIRIVPSKDGRKVYCSKKNNAGLTIALSKVMPIGKYYANKDRDFILAEQ